MMSPELEKDLEDLLRNRKGWWIYDEDHNHREVGLTEYSEWSTKKMMEGIDWRRVAKTDIGDIFISTVFLGIDHSWGGSEPVLYETMIFAGEHDGFQRRYKTWEEAEIGHQKAVELVQGTIKEEDI